MSIARFELPTVLFLLFPLVSCAEHPAGEAKASNEAAAVAPTKAAESDAPAAGEACSDVACQSNNDCCSGYVCGFDPERSRVQRYCLGQ